MYEKLKAFLRDFFLVTIPSLLILMFILEFIVFRYILPASYIPLADFDEEYRMAKYIPGQKGTYRCGWNSSVRAEWRINNEGWNSHRDYFPRLSRPGATLSVAISTGISSGTSSQLAPAGLRSGEQRPFRIAFIGDSYVEARQVEQNEACHAVLEKSLREAGYEVEVYAFGFSGACLSQYLHMARYARKKFSPDMYIILLVHNDFDESLASAVNLPYFMQYRRVKAPDGSSYFEETVPEKQEKSWVRRSLYKSSIVRFLYINLNLSQIYFVGNFGRKAPVKFEANISRDALENPDIREVTELVFSKFASFVREDSTPVMLLMDANRRAIYDGIDPDSTKSHDLNKMVRTLAARQNLPMIDMTYIFREDYKLYSDTVLKKSCSSTGLLDLKNSREVPRRYEFTVDNHWNRIAHSLAGKALAKKILELGLIKHTVIK